MTKQEFKKAFVGYAKDMVNKWFDTDSIQDKLCKSLATTLLNANIDKYDNVLEYFCNKDGQMCLDDFFDAMIEDFKPIHIDLNQYGVPFLPKKILLIGKQDLMMLKNICKENYGDNNIA